MGFIALTPAGTIGARQQEYERLLGDQSAQYQHAADAASRRVQGDVATATQGGGNVLNAGRQAANASRDVQTSLAARGQEITQGIHAQALEMAKADAQRQADQERQAVGGFLGAGGQLAGSVVGMMYGGPQGAQLGGALGGMGGNLIGGAAGGAPQGQGGGGSGGGGGGNPLSSIPILGSLLGGGQSQQQQGLTPQQQVAQVAPPPPPPVAPTGTPVTPGQPPVSPQAPMSGTPPIPGATQRVGPDGQMHWFDAQGNQVG